MKEEKWEKDLRECSYDSPADFLWFYVIQGCGCGSSGKFKADFWDMFGKIAKDKPDKYDFIYKNEYNELIAQMLDSAGLLKHGSSIAGSWLSDNGQKLYKALQEKPSSEDGQITKVKIGMI